MGGYDDAGAASRKYVRNGIVANPAVTHDAFTANCESRLERYRCEIQAGGQFEMVWCGSSHLSGCDGDCCRSCLPFQ
ncbi:hypothetical protein D3C74_369070 [compost metagenome]